MRNIKQILSWVLAVTMLFTNVDYVSAASESSTTLEEVMAEEISIGDVVEQSVSEGDMSVSDTADITVLHSGEQYGVTWEITSDGVLTISGKKTADITTSITPEWREYETEFTKAVVTAENIHSTSKWFSGCSMLNTIDLSNFDTSQITDMSYMFRDCIRLNSLDLSNFNTANVTNMHSMFKNCEEITSLDLSGFNTSKVTTMSAMFYGCYALPSLELSHFDTSSVTSMSYMFDSCKSLTDLDLSSFNTSKVTTFDGMFWYCSELVSLDLSKFDTSNVTDMCNMFRECSSLKSLDLSNFDTSKVRWMSCMFWYCSSLTNLDVSSFDTSNVCDMTGMFCECNNVTALDVSDFDTSNVERMSKMFHGCKALATLDVSNFNTSKVTEMQGMFRNCFSLTTLDVSNFDTSNVTDIINMFRNCRSLKSLDVSNFDLSSFDMSLLDSNDETYMFYGCSGITQIKTIPNLTFEIKLPVSPMYDAQYNEYITFPQNLSEGINLYSGAKYTVKFDSCLGEDVFTVTNILSGQTITLPTEPSRAGYNFSGWYTGEDGEGTEFTAQTVVTEDLYLYAYWQPKELLELTFEQSAYELRQEENMQVLPVYNPEDTFICWTLQWTSSDPKVATVGEDGVVTAVKKGTTTITASAVNGVSAQYVLTITPLLRTVTFDTGLGYAPTQIANIEDGTTITLPEAPIRENYVFGGWFTQKDGVGTEFTSETLVEANLYLYAYWIPDGLWTTEVEPQTYTGKAIKPVILVYEGDTLLKEKVDYTISYKNNTNVSDASAGKKAPTIIVKGKGNYKDKETISFQILAKDIADEDIIVAELAKSFNNKVQKPVPVLTYNGKKLKNNKDFTISYPSKGGNAYKEPGTYTIKIVGKGNYKGEREITFVITDAVLMGKTKIAAVPKQIYTGSAIEPELVVTYKGNPLIRDTDYTVIFEDNVEVGKATAVITGIDKFAGSRKITFQIVGESISKATVEGITNKIYNGREQTQTITVKLGDKKLNSDTDYDVTYTKNINAGTANMVITGKGQYSGTIKKSFKITAYDLSKDSAKLLHGVPQNLKVAYTKGGSKPALELTFDGTELVAKKDYTISYKNNTKLANSGGEKAPTITIKGNGNFKGTIDIQFSIEAKNLTDSEDPVTIRVPDIAYNPKAGKFMSKPVLTDSNGKKLAVGTDYDKNIVYTKSDGTVLTKADIPQVGDVVKVTVTGKGCYVGTIEATYKITQASFAKTTIKVEPQSYTGKAVILEKDDLTVKIGKTDLVYGQDYVIVEDSYKNNVKKGTASVTIKGIGNYGGEKTVKFKIASKKFVWFWDLFY